MQDEVGVKGLETVVLQYLKTYCGCEKRIYISGGRQRGGGCFHSRVKDFLNPEHLRKQEVA